MLSASSVMLNGTISTSGENLFVSQNTINYNSGAVINTSGQPLFVVAPNLAGLIQNFNAADGSSVSIPATS